ncbi:hypothetical protein PR002_g28165 [Phytophthora rubi]|uniref:Secreted protein n=1 Tax=Phytophthora rubi TaxID=129364 RepID=A0A6A3HDX3_9STRA|nr:hypothetical protein PR002_g28165 [Phytophthora rubi]
MPLVKLLLELLPPLLAKPCREGVHATADRVSAVLAAPLSVTNPCDEGVNAGDSVGGVDRRHVDQDRAAADRIDAGDDDTLA